MNHRSFRLRIALLSTLLAGSALVGFSSITWQLMYVAKVGQLDAKLESHVRRLARPLPKDLWSTATTLPQPLAPDSNPAIALRVLDPDGAVLYESANWLAAFNQPHLFPPRPPLPPNGEPRPDRPPPPLDAPPNQFPVPRLPPPERPIRWVTQHTAEGSWRIGAASFPATQVAIAISLHTIDQEMIAIRNIFLIAIPGTLLLVAGGAWWLAGSALHPIQRLTAVMQQITVTGLDQRVPIGSTDVEFVQLIQVFNQMIERLDRSFQQASQFSADAAHELKTPLAILQGELEHALQRTTPDSDEQQWVNSLLDEVRRLSGIVRKLLLLSLADAGQLGLHKTRVNLSDLLAVMVEDLDLLAPHLTVQTEIVPELSVQGDRDLLTQVLQNLISNAIKYNLPNGWIHIRATRQSGMVQVAIANASTEIPARDRDRIFDRFYRGDPARSRKVEGLGLGLSLSREIVHAHHGTLTLTATQPQQTTFTLTLPKGA